MVVAFEQQIYAKAMGIKWKHSEQFEGIVVRMGAFQTICTLLGKIGKRLQGAEMRDLCVEAQVIAIELSVVRRVNNALTRQAWCGFRKWVPEKHDEKTSLVCEMFSSLQSLRDNV